MGRGPRKPTARRKLRAGAGVYFLLIVAEIECDAGQRQQQNHCQANSRVQAPDLIGREAIASWIANDPYVVQHFRWNAELFFELLIGNPPEIVRGEHKGLRINRGIVKCHD
jgi:hypothetical protein